LPSLRHEGKLPQDDSGAAQAVRVRLYFLEARLKASTTDG